MHALQKLKQKLAKVQQFIKKFATVQHICARKDAHICVHHTPTAKSFGRGATPSKTLNLAISQVETFWQREGTELETQPWHLSVHALSKRNISGIQACVCKHIQKRIRTYLHIHFASAATMSCTRNTLSRIFTKYLRRL